jgi:hypothetical protein
MEFYLNISSFFFQKGPSYQSGILLEFITAPYTDNVQVKLPYDMFNYVSMADYFIVYVGNEIDCGIIDNLYFFILFEKRDFF